MERDLQLTGLSVRVFPNDPLLSGCRCIGFARTGFFMSTSRYHQVHSFIHFRPFTGSEQQHGAQEVNTVGWIRRILHLYVFIQGIALLIASMAYLLYRIWPSGILHLIAKTFILISLHMTKLAIMTGSILHHLIISQTGEIYFFLPIGNSSFHFSLRQTVWWFGFFIITTMFTWIICDYLVYCQECRNRLRAYITFGLMLFNMVMGASSLLIWDDYTRLFFPL